MEQDVPGLFQCGVLVRFCASALIRSLNRSVKLKWRYRLKSSWASPGPRSQDRPSPVLPICTDWVGVKALGLNQYWPGPVPFGIDSVPEKFGVWPVNGVFRKLLVWLTVS